MVEARLETGRTHQVRVHFSDHGHPLLGDPDYGGLGGTKFIKQLSRKLARQALHARLLCFDHPTDGKRHLYEANPPADFQAALDTLRKKKEGA